jgi:Derlin-2/3
MAVWTYSTGLELNSPRFSQPGDFFTYVVFVASVILVSSSVELRSFFSVLNLTYLPAQPHSS